MKFKVGDKVIIVHDREFYRSCLKLDEIFTLKQSRASLYSGQPSAWYVIGLNGLNTALYEQDLERVSYASTVMKAIRGEK